MYIQKVAKTAKLLGIKGSVAQREQLEDVLHAKFSQQIKDTFESQGFVTKKQVKGFLKELGKNVSVKVKESNHPAMGNKYSFFNRNVIKSKYLKLPFADKKRIYKDDLESINNLHHEAEHYIVEIVESKYAAHLSTLENLPPSLKVQQNAFYYGKLYLNLPKNEAKTYQKEAANFSVHNIKKQSENNDINDIENAISNFFIDNKCTREQRINLFQGWRHGLRSEIKSYGKGSLAEMEYKYPLTKLTKRLKNGERLKLNENFELINQNLSFDSAKYKSHEEQQKALELFIEDVKLAKIQDSQEYFDFKSTINVIEEKLSDTLKYARRENQRRIKANKGK